MAAFMRNRGTVAGRNRWPRNSGQVLVETALVFLFVLLPLLFGIIEFGRALYVVNSLNNAARQGARTAAVSPWALAQSKAENAVRTAMPVDPTGINVAVASSPSSPPTSGNDSITVTVTLPFNTIAGNIIPQLKNITLTGKASMRYEL